MPDLYTAHLWDGSLSTPGSVSSPAPPTGYLWVIRNIVVGCGSNVAGVFILTDDATDNLYMVFRQATPGVHGSTQYWTGRIVLEPPNFLDAVVESGADWFWWIDGYVLSTT